MDALPNRPDPSFQLTKDAYYLALHDLRRALPPPLENTPDGIARRDNGAIAQVAALCPANADEVLLASQYVAAHLQALDCISQARDYRVEPDLMIKCTAQAASMLRQAQGARRLLLGVQAARQKLNTDNAATDRAAWTEHCAAQLLTQALHEAPPTPARDDAVRPVSLDPPDPAPPPEPVEPPQAEPDAAADQPEPEAEDDEPHADLVAEAEQYAVLYPQRAAVIRRCGRVPDYAMFGPPSDALVRAVVAGRTPALLAVDQPAIQSRVA